MNTEEIIKNLTIYKVMKMIEERMPKSRIFSFPEIGKRYTYERFNEKVNEAASALIAQGMGKGSHIGLWMNNIEQWYIMFFAINKIGAIAVPINTGFKSTEMDNTLKNFDIDMLIISDGYNHEYPMYIDSIIQDMKVPNSNYPRLKKIITIGFENKNCIKYKEMIESGKKVSKTIVEEYANSTCSSDVCIILPTSGTTGIPKGVKLTNIQLIKNGLDIGDRYQLSSKDKMLIQVPMFHCFGITLSMMAALTHCTSMSIISHFNPELALYIIEKERITSINGVPTMYNAIINCSNFDEYDISCLKKGIMAGSDCIPKFMIDVSFKMKIKLFSVYGLSEASPGCTMSSVTDYDHIRNYTVGEALPGIECMIVDIETGEEVPVGVQGEFIVRGYNVMSGYYNDNDTTNATIDKNGFLHTGDLATRIDKTHYKITGRIKDVIIRGGENIYPNEIISAINAIPGVKDSCVFGIPNEKYGQVVKACIITDGTISKEFIRNYLSKRIAEYKVPAQIEFVDDFIKNAAGKVLVYKMQEVYGN